MNSRRSEFLVYPLLVCLVFLVVPATSAQSPVAVQERIAAVKQSLATSVQPKTFRCWRYRSLARARACLPSSVN